MEFFKAPSSTVLIRSVLTTDKASCREDVVNTVMATVLVDVVAERLVLVSGCEAGSSEWL